MRISGKSGYAFGLDHLGVFMIITQQIASFSPFGSGCSAVVTQATIENRKGGKRTFLGFFDPSVRPHFEADKLSYTIPMSRFKKMYETMRQSCLFDTHAWGKIKERMNG